MGSSSKAATTTSTTTNQVSRNLNLQDTEGVTIGEAGGNVTVISSDFSAIDNATRLAQGALDASTELGTEAARLSYETSQLVSETNRTALQTTADVASGAVAEIANFGKSFGDSAFSTVDKALGRVSGAYSDASQFQKAALSEVSATQAGALDTLSNTFKAAFQGVTDFVGNLQERAQSQLGDTVTALNQIATENSKSTDQRVAEISGNAIKYVVIGLGLVVVGVGAVFIFRSK